MDINTFFLAESNAGAEQIVGGLAIYIYTAYAVMVLARRIGMEKAWLAWIPIANLYLLTKMAGREWWWMLGLLIPFVNFIVAGYIWSEIGKKFGKPWWVGAIAAIPLVGLAIPGYLVIAGKDQQSSGHSVPPAS